MNNNFKISIVSPVYKAESIIPLLVKRITEVVIKITSDYEIILVEDSGPDNSWQIIKDICDKDTHVKGIKLSKNFGQHYAISAGLDLAIGDWVIIMDCDLQDRPEEILNLYNKAMEGYHIVYASRHDRKDTFLKKLSSKTFYSVLSYLSGTKQDSSIANFGIYHKDVIDKIKLMREHIRYFPSMVKWVGFKSTKINVEHQERESGKTSYNLNKLLNLGVDIILAYSDKPIRLAIKLGFFISLFSMIFAIYTLVQFFLGNIIVSGYTSLIISIWLLSGLTILILGIVGLYVGKIFEGVKDRPIYIIQEILNHE